MASSGVRRGALALRWTLALRGTLPLGGTLPSGVRGGALPSGVVASAMDLWSSVPSAGGLAPSVGLAASVSARTLGRSPLSFTGVRGRAGRALGPRCAEALLLLPPSARWPRSTMAAARATSGQARAPLHLLALDLADVLEQRRGVHLTLGRLVDAGQRSVGAELAPLVDLP